MDKDWSIHFRNNSENNMYFYLHYYEKKKVTYPNYGDLVEQRYLHLIPAHEEGDWSMSPTKFKNGTKGHVYVFSPDTLERYSWNEVVEQKKYWFAEIVCDLREIYQFPEEFEYMGNIY